MELKLEPALEAALKAQAQKEGIAPEDLAIKTLSEKFKAREWPIEPRDEWERGLLSIAIDCGVSLTNEQLSREHMYD